MEIKKYQLLCKFCDKLLKNNKFNQINKFIPLLHVVRPHPKDMHDYRNILSEEFNYNFHLVRFKKILLTYLKLVFKIFKYFILNNKIFFYSSMPKNVKNIDIFILSHLIHPEKTRKEYDFYFGNMIKSLNNKKFSSTIILFNYHNKFNSKKLIKRWTKSKIYRIILSNYLDFLTELNIILKFLIGRIKLKKSINNTKNIFEKKIILEASDECISESSLRSYRIGLQIQKLVKLYNPKIIILTYEGYAWERLVFFSARKINPNITCIGYQHAYISIFYHSIKRNISKYFDPNIILTSGSNGYKIIKKDNKFSASKLVEIGTHRNLKINAKKRKNNKKLFCVVLPEGIIEESYLLFSFSLTCARLNPSINFIWRVHPIMNFNKFKKKYKKFTNIPKNIIISNQELENDLNKCNWALYKGSTSIIQALKYGIKPIYLNYEKSYRMDPLHDFKFWRAEINYPKEINNFINEKELLNIKNSKKRKLVTKISTKYYSSYNEKKFISLISKEVKNFKNIF